MELTIKSYLTNPTGKGATIIPGSNQIKQEYIKQLSELKPRITLKWYLYKNYLIGLIRLPSRSCMGLKYDVIIEIDTSDKEKFDGKTINNFPIRVFSNCPSFSYTYANVFNQANILIPWLRNKYQKSIIKDAPDTRNPYHIVGYERSLYISLLYISSESRNLYNDIKNIAMKINTLTDLQNAVYTQEYIERTYKELKEKAKKDEAKKKETLNKPTPKKPHTAFSHSGTLSRTKTTSHNSKTSRISKTGKVKKTR